MAELSDLRFFGRRKGKAIKPSKQQLIDKLLPRLKPVLPTNGEKYDMNTFFGIRPSEVWLEIGFGGGEHLAELSKRNPAIGFIGAEPFINGVVSLLSHLNGSFEKQTKHANLEAVRVDNVRIWPDDVRKLFPFFKDGLFQRIFLLYPDPWPKIRHAERRFINAANLRHLYRLLTDDGCLFVATDVADYASWTMEQTALDGRFQQINPNIYYPPADWIPTRYEKKGIKAGRKPIYLIFQKSAK